MTQKTRTLETIILRNHNKILRRRQIQRILESRRLRNLWALSTEDQKDKLAFSIDAGDLKLINYWMDKHPKKDWFDLSVRRLRQEARELGIVNYCRLTKVQLVKALEAKHAIEPHEKSD